VSYNGSGTFVINSAGQPVVTGTVISSTAFNALTADLATGLSTAITKDGQTTTTARILFAQGVSSTLVTDATSSTTGSIITAGGISTQKALWVGTTSRLVGNVQADGLVGIGMTPVNVLDITQNQNGLSIVKLLNSNAGAGALAFYSVSNGTSALNTVMYGTGFTTSGVSRQNGGYIGAGGAGGLTFTTEAAQPIYFGINLAEKARFDTSGNLLVGTTSSSSPFGSAGFVKATGFVSKTGGSKALAVSNAVSNVIEIGSYTAPTYFLITWKNETSAGGGNAQYGSMLVTIVGGASAATLGTKATCEYSSYRGDPSVTWSVATSGGTSYLTAYCTNASFSSTLTYNILLLSGNTPTFL